MVVFFGVGLLVSMVQLVFRPDAGTMNGSSSAVFAIAMYATVHRVRSHRADLAAVPKEVGPVAGAMAYPRYWLSHVIPILMPVMVVLELTGVISHGATAAISHATGVTIGAFAGVVLPALRTQPCTSNGRR